LAWTVLYDAHEFPPDYDYPLGALLCSGPVCQRNPFTMKTIPSVSALHFKLGSRTVEFSRVCTAITSSIAILRLPQIEFPGASNTDFYSSSPRVLLGSLRQDWRLQNLNGPQRRGLLQKRGKLENSRKSWFTIKVYHLLFHGRARVRL
jgi:hypothetical protein